MRYRLSLTLESSFIESGFSVWLYSGVEVGEKLHLSTVSFRASGKNRGGSPTDWRHVLALLTRVPINRSDTPFIHGDWEVIGSDLMLLSLKNWRI